MKTTSTTFDDSLAINIPNGLSTLTLTLPVPENSTAFGYTQTVGSVNVTTPVKPTRSTTSQDINGNSIKVLEFDQPAAGNITVDTTIDSTTIGIDLDKPVPQESIQDIVAPSGGADYSAPTALVESGDPQITTLAKTFSADTQDEATVVKRIQQWMQANVIYDSRGTDGSDDAVSVLSHHTALSDGWVNLFLALLRANKIPARFVGGFNLGGSVAYPSETSGESTMTISSSSKSASWAEVWFPSAGWVPFEPQTSAGFVDSHHLKAWSGPDSAIGDQVVSWTSSRNMESAVSVTETVAQPQNSDDVRVTCYNLLPEKSPMTILARRLANDAPPPGP